jgi:hypothetical protein
MGPKAGRAGDPLRHRVSGAAQQLARVGPAEQVGGGVLAPSPRLEGAWRAAQRDAR